MVTLSRSVRPVLTISQMFCAAPFPIRFLSPNSSYGRLRIIAGAVIQLILAGVLLVFACLSVWYKRTHRMTGPQMAFFTYVLYHVDLLLGTFNCALIFAVCQWKRSSYELILERMQWIMDLSKEAKLLTGGNDVGWLWARFNWLLATSGIYLAAVITIDWFYHQDPIQLAWNLGATFGPSLVQLLSLFQYAYVLVFTHRKCKAINEELRTMARDVLRSELASYAGRFPPLRQLHQQLHRLAFRVQGPFGVLVMMSIVSILSAACVTCLEVYQQSRGKEFTAQTGLYVTFGLLWVLFQVGRLLLILYPNYLMESEVNSYVSNNME